MKKAQADRLSANAQALQKKRNPNSTPAQLAAAGRGAVARHQARVASAPKTYTTGQNTPAMKDWKVVNDRNMYYNNTNGNKPLESIRNEEQKYWSNQQSDRLQDEFMRAKANAVKGKSKF